MFRRVLCKFIWYSFLSLKGQFHTIFYPYCFDYNILYGSIMNMLKQLCQLFQPNSISSHKNLSIKHLPTIFNLQKCYHPVSFICEWSMPLYKIKRKEKYSSIEAELSLLVYLLYLFMGVGKCPLPPPKSCVLLWPEPYVLFGSSPYSTVRHFFTGTKAFLTLIVQYA